MIEAMNGMCFIDEQTVKQTKGGIYLPERGKTLEKCATGVIIALHEDCDEAKGFNVGDTVLYPTNAITSVKLDDKPVAVLGLCYILGITERVVTEDTPDVIGVDTIVPGPPDPSRRLPSIDVG